MPVISPQDVTHQFTLYSRTLAYSMKSPEKVRILFLNLIFFGNFYITNLSDTEIYIYRNIWINWILLKYMDIIFFAF